MLRIFLPFLLMLSACSTPYNPLSDYRQVSPSSGLSAPQPIDEPSAADTDEQVAQGKYLVELLGCGSCHTNGAILGTPDYRQQLAGSDIGIAYTNPLADKNPGVVFPVNLTPDPETGLGDWTDEQIGNVIRNGIRRHGPGDIAVMPWQAYAKLSEPDTQAIVAYLRSLPPVKHQVPANVPEGRKTNHRFVHFGVYQSR